MVVMAAPAAQAATVAVCHATNSDTNPYELTSVDDSSTDDPNGHYAHATDTTAMQTWKKGTWWNGTWRPAGSPKPDLIEGTSWEDPITSALCDGRGVTGPRTVTPGVTFVDPRCTISAAITFEHDDAVVYAVTGTPAPGAAVQVTASPEPGYVFPAGSTTSWSHTFSAAPTGCDGVLEPGAVTLNPPRCTGPGTSTSLTYALPAGPEGVSYGQPTITSTSFVVTAWIEQGVDKVFATDLPPNWRLTSPTTATFTRTFSDVGDCIVSIPVIEPYATANTCTAGGALVLPVPEDGGYRWTGATNGAGPGTYQVTAVADTGYALTGQTSHSVVVDAAGVGLTCPGEGNDPVEVTPLAPTFVEAGCTTDPRIDYRRVEGVSYGYTGALVPGGTVNVTASALEDFVLKSGETAAWTHTFRAKPSGVACGGTTPEVPVETDELVTPLAPSATDANCSGDGRLVVPAQPAGVLVERTGAVPGDVAFTFSPAAGYAFPAGTDTHVTVTVPAQLTGVDCIQGVETSKPKPQPGTDTPDDGPGAAPVGGTDAEVLGEQAVAVPTAVAAGVGGATSVTSATASPQLASALVAGGLLMLVAGGATGLGRRTRGAHES
ncbi:MAG: hypothetical protein ACLGH4_07755 [Actinomycetes bacterium]